MNFATTEAALLDRASGEVAYCKSLGRKISVAVETQDVGEPNVSFFDQGKQYMQNVLAAVNATWRAQAGGLFEGIIVHDSTHWPLLKDSVGYSYNGVRLPVGVYVWQYWLALPAYTVERDELWSFLAAQPYTITTIQFESELLLRTNQAALQSFIDEAAARGYKVTLSLGASVLAETAYHPYVESLMQLAANFYKYGPLATPYSPPAGAIAPQFFDVIPNNVVPPPPRGGTSPPTQPPTTKPPTQPPTQPPTAPPGGGPCVVSGGTLHVQLPGGASAACVTVYNREWRFLGIAVAGAGGALTLPASALKGETVLYVEAYGVASCGFASYLTHFSCVAAAGGGGPAPTTPAPTHSGGGGGGGGGGAPTFPPGATPACGRVGSTLYVYNLPAAATCVLGYSLPAYALQSQASLPRGAGQVAMPDVPRGPQHAFEYYSTHNGPGECSGLLGIIGCGA